MTKLKWDLCFVDHTSSLQLPTFCSVSDYNLALGKYIRQSSTYLKYKAQKAIDSCTQRTHLSNCCTHSDNDFEPWLELDLGAPYSIGQVVIHRRYEEACKWWYTIFCEGFIIVYYIFPIVSLATIMSVQVFWHLLLSLPKYKKSWNDSLVAL